MATSSVRGGRAPGRVLKSPLAFPGTTPARMLFLVSPPGHEGYLDEIGELICQGSRPDQAAIAEIRARNDIQQLTLMTVAQSR